MTVDFDIAIVGGGASGVLTAIHLLRRARRPVRIALVERSARIGEGIAYGTDRAEHLLNVVASRMSAIDDDATHFVRHLLDQMPTRDGVDVASSFAPRREYARYLRRTLDDATRASPASISIVHDEIVSIDCADAMTLAGRSCRTMRARFAVLALGNWPRTLTATPHDAIRPLLAAWQTGSIASIDADETVAIAGAGLSMIDVLLTLAAQGHRGQVHVVSRRGLFPQPHATPGRADIDVDAIARMPLARRAASLRVAARALVARGAPWQWVMDTLRPHGASLWSTLDTSAQRRFLHHAAPFWDVHRHRIAPEVSRTVDAMRASGQLVRHRGRVERIEGHAGGWLVTFATPSIQRHSTTLIVDRVVGSIGLQLDLRAVGDALVASMFQCGTVRAGPHGLGFDTDTDGALVERSGAPRDRLFTLGSARIGQLWESIAVPELRAQASRIADRLLAALDADDGAEPSGERHGSKPSQ